MSQISYIRAAVYAALFALMYMLILSAGNAALALLGPATPRAPVTEIGRGQSPHPKGVVIPVGLVASSRVTAPEPSPPPERGSATKR